MSICLLILSCCILLIGHTAISLKLPILKVSNAITNSPNRIQSVSLHATTSNKNAGPITPEFSRILNVGQIPEKRPVLCKLLATEKERRGVAERFDIPDLLYFASNITLSRSDSISILVEGTIEAHIKTGDDKGDVELFEAAFDTLLLNNAEGGEFGGSKEGYKTGIDEPITLEYASNYDDEVAANGEVDIGEISAQYLGLEMY